LLMPSHSCPDVEFSSDRPIIGISVSYQIIRQWHSKESYIDIVARFCAQSIRRWNVQIVLIPNELWIDRYDDRSVAQEILDQIENKDCVFVFPAERFTASQLKGLIARCDMLIASRYHSVVAAMSTGVPAVVIGWHYKYSELLEKFGQEQWLLSSENCTFDALFNLCEKLWNKRAQAKIQIRENLTVVEREIYKAGERLKNTVPNKANL